MTDSDVRRLEDKVDGVALALARLEGSLQPTLEKLTGEQDDTRAAVEDHEKRLRSLERFRFSIPSISLLSLVATVAGFLYLLLNHGG